MGILLIMNKFQPKNGNSKGFIILDFLEEKRALVTVWVYSLTALQVAEPIESNKKCKYQWKDDA